MPAEIQTFLALYPPQAQELALHLTELVFKIAQGAIEQLDLPAKLLGCGFANSYKGTLGIIMPLKSGVSLGFPRGAELPDPKDLLTGTGKHARHVRTTSSNNVDTPALSALLEASVAAVKR